MTEEQTKQAAQRKEGGLSPQVISPKISQVVPQANEQILKKTKLLKVQPAPEELLKLTAQADSQRDTDFLSEPWQGLEPEKVRLNKYISLGYIPEENLKCLIERLHRIQKNHQKQFKKIIWDIQSNEDESKLQEYRSRILEGNQVKNFNILFLDFSGYLKSLLHRPTRRVLQMADLVYPQGVLMQSMFRALSLKLAQNSAPAGKPQPHYDFLTKFDFTVSLLSSMDEYHCSIFLIGGMASDLNRVEKIFQTSFSHIKVLGRYTALYRKGKGQRIRELCTFINKSSPTLLLLSKNSNIHDFIDSKKGESQIRSFLVLDYSEALHDFSGKPRRKKEVILPFVLYLIFPWKWPELLCMSIFLLKIVFLSMTTTKKNR